jgi:hypothetical protein
MSLSMNVLGVSAQLKSLQTKFGSTQERVLEAAKVQLRRVS